MHAMPFLHVLRAVISSPVVRFLLSHLVPRHGSARTIPQSRTRRALTKSFSTQLAILTLLAIHLGRGRGTVSAVDSAALIAGLRALPGQVERVHSLERDLEALALEWQATPNALYLGRGPLYPVALEGALKLKEISYIHAQGFPAGEMKHGPIALIDAPMAVIPCSRTTCTQIAC
jgi:glucosamine 6-phosphate synthetase-like amidotransferase/phosphosugar isomerase protein